MRNARCYAMAFACAICVLLFMPDTVQAGSTNAISELSTGVERVEATVSGPILKSVAIIALVVGGLMLAFGGELSNTAKMMAQLFLAIGLAGGATSIVTNVFSISGASIDAPTTPDLPQAPEGDAASHGGE